MDSPLGNNLIVDHHHRKVIIEPLQIHLVGDVDFVEGVLGLGVSFSEVLEHSCDVTFGSLAEVAPNARDHFDENVIGHASRLWH